MGATRVSDSARKNLISGVRPISKTQMNDVFTSYQSDQKVKVGDVTVSAKHLEKVSPDKLTNPALKQQIVEVIQTSINATDWQNLG